MWLSLSFHIKVNASILVDGSQCTNSFAAYVESLYSIVFIHISVNSRFFTLHTDPKSEACNPMLPWLGKFISAIITVAQ